MNGLKICALIVLLASPVITHAQVTDVVEVVNVTDVTTDGKVEATAAEAAPVEAAVEPTHVVVDQLLEKAKRDNANRANMKRAQLSETECLATAMYHEARGEGEKGMAAVAFVIYNRVSSHLFPKSYCQVVLQRSQFSFTSDRNPDNIKEWGVYAKVLAMAVELVQNGGFQRKKSPVGNALFFNSFRSRSGWSYANARKFVATIGNHHFFR